MTRTPVLRFLEVGFVSTARCLAALTMHLRPRLLTTLLAAAALLILATIAPSAHATAAPQAVDDPGLMAAVSKVLAGDPGVSEVFGYSVSISGDTAVIGAPYHATNGISTGAAYVFVRSGTGWVQEAELVSDGAWPDDRFGSAVAIDGQTIVVGAEQAHAGASRSGAAYVFVRSGATWAQQAKLTASDREGDEKFGWAVSLSGDTVAIGAPRDNDHDVDSGSAYIFARSGSTWEQQQKLLAPDGSAGDRFAESASISGDTVVLGAPGDDDHGSSSGSGYVFNRTGALWLVQEKLTDAGGAESDYFGQSAAISGETLVLGASQDAGGGSAHVFTRLGSSWFLESRLSAADGSVWDHFGHSASIFGDIIVIGSPRMGGRSGAAYVFERSGVSWSQRTRLHDPQGAANDYFGYSVCVSNGGLAIGSVGDGTRGFNAGSAFLPVRSYRATEDEALAVAAPGVLGNDADTDGDSLTATLTAGAAHGAVTLGEDGSFVYTPQANWNGSDSFTYSAFDGVEMSQPATVSIEIAPVNDAPVAMDDTAMQQLIKSPDRFVGEGFGTAVAISGDTAVVGAYSGNTMMGGAGKGATYVFTRSGTNWILSTKLVAADGFLFDGFGSQVAIDGDTIVVGAGASVGGQGAVYVFTRSADGWVQQSKLTVPDARSNAAFGSAVAVTGDTVVAGALYDYNAGIPSGSVYVFTRSGAEWIREAKLAPVDRVRSGFGAALAAEGDTVVIGAPLDDAKAFDAGRAYVFSRSASVWSKQAELVADDARMLNYFGMSVALSSGSVIVGSPRNAGKEGSTGAAYVFSSAEGVWSQEAKLVAEDGASYDMFGDAVAISGDTAVVGAYGVSGVYGAGESGAAYVFTRSGHMWAQQLKRTPEPRSPANRFGDAVAVSGTSVFTSAPSVETLRGTVLTLSLVFENTKATFTAPGVLGNDSDPDGDPLAAILRTPPGHGTVNLASDGSFVYTPEADWSGTDTFAYRSFDGQAYSSPATVTIQVLSVNQAPEFTAKDRTIATDEDAGPVAVPWASSISAGRGEAEPSSFTVTCTNPALFASAPSIDASGVLHFVSSPDRSGSATATATLRDSLGAASEPVTFTIKVVPVNDPPSFVPGTGITVESDAGSFERAWASTISPGPLESEETSFVVSAGEPQIFSEQPTIDSTGTLRFTPAAGRFGSTVVTAVLRDEFGAESDAATFTITVNRSAIVTRVAGSDRYGTAAALARKGWDPAGANAWTGVKHIVIANGEPGKEPDPLTAAGLAGAYDAPVLTVQAARLPNATKTIITEIARNNPDVRIHLVGGTSVVPDARWNEIRKISGVSQVKDRIWGTDRYATSAAMANRIVTVKGADAIEGVILIAGDNPAAFYDALAASPIAYARTMPMLSVKRGSIPTSVNTVLKSAALKDKPRYAASSATFIGTTAASGATRLTTSSNRYDAAAGIARFAIDRGWTSAQNTALATQLPDALSGGAFLGRVGGVMLFTGSTNTLDPIADGFIGDWADGIDTGWVMGGSEVLPVEQEEAFRARVNRGAKVVRIAMGYLGRPYLNGATGPNSFDSSGFTCWVFRQVGVSLTHSSANQIHSGRAVSRAALLPGDLVFFGSPISHVGIYIGDDQCVRAVNNGAGVQVTSMDGFSGACRP